MPTNNFKLFDENKANLLSDTEYLNATQRLNGVQTGVASSQLNNKFAYQVSLVAYAIAQIMNQNNLDASDTLSVSAFVGNLGGALLQKVADKASSTEAAAGVLNNKYITPATMKAAALLLSGGTMKGPIAMGNNKITGLATPIDSTDAATKGYVDGVLPFTIVNAGTFTSANQVITLSKENLLKCSGLLFNLKFNTASSSNSTYDGFVSISFCTSSGTIDSSSGSASIFGIKNTRKTTVPVNLTLFLTKTKTSSIAYSDDSLYKLSLFFNDNLRCQVDYENYITVKISYISFSGFSISVKYLI